MPGFWIRLGLLLSALVLLLSFLPGGAAPALPEAIPHLATSAPSGPVRPVQPTPPNVSARAAIVVEYPSGRILFEKNSHLRLAPASTTKIMTAIVAMEYGKLDEKVVVSQKDMIYGSKMGLKTGETQTVRNLLYGLMLPSGNDAAMTLGRHVATKLGAGTTTGAFAWLMNKKVAALGLKNSNFVNPHGLDKKGHFSSAYDLASMTWYAMQYDLFNEIVKQENYDAPGHKLKNLNKLLTRYSGAEGVKTGYTRRAGSCLVASATRDGKRVISVVLNDPKMYDESAALLDYGFAKLAATPNAAGEILAIAVK
ncbi:MAG TPA: D-alanyl-D-alanine carboxypeptidase family protein [Chloroflexia bacterium]|nr:D-alanyl-D-alanine carboxypeptidase family protein [Chloroflexia bacterium]